MATPTANITPNPPRQPSTNVSDTAQRTWVKSFATPPFTSLHMVDYLITKSNTTYKEFVVSPQNELRHVKKSDFLKDDLHGEALRKLWDLNSGHCTSLAIKVANRLQELYPTTFDFKFYDISKHRLARCSKTPLLIDSSSRKGIAIVPNDGIWGNGGRIEWRFSGTTLTYHKQKRTERGEEIQ